jgi:hypothetical protein
MYRTLVTGLLLFPASLACNRAAAPPSSASSNIALSTESTRDEEEGVDDEDQPAPDSREIHAAVDQRSAEIRQCYMLGTFRDAQLQGTVNVLFTINPNGRVTDTTDGGSDMPDPQVVDCVLDVFAKMEFRAGGYYPTQVQFPISFGKS